MVYVFYLWFFEAENHLKLIYILHANDYDELCVPCTSFLGGRSSNDCFEKFKKLYIYIYIYIYTINICIINMYHISNFVVLTYPVSRTLWKGKERSQ